MRIGGFLRFFASVLMLTSAGCLGSDSGVKVDGSSTVYPITEAVAEEFRKAHGSVKLTVGFSGTGGGMKKFWQGEIDVCNASREMKESERERCQENGIEFLEFPVAIDGLAIVANPENDWCDCLTVDELKTIWRPQSPIHSWSDIDPNWPQQEIKLYGPGTDSGTFDYFVETIVGEAGASRADYMANENDNTLVTGIQSDTYALGYFGFAYYEENADRLKLLAVDNGNGNCVKPTSETVRDTTYAPLSRPLFIYVNKASLARPIVASFLEFYLANANELARSVGYFPLDKEVHEANRQKLQEALDAHREASQSAAAGGSNASDANKYSEY